MIIHRYYCVTCKTKDRSQLVHKTTYNKIFYYMCKTHVRESRGKFLKQRNKRQQFRENIEREEKEYWLKQLK